MTSITGGPWIDSLIDPGRAGGLPPLRRCVIYNQMVVDQVNEEDIDLLFHALADSTRRDIVIQAAAGDLSVSALARRYPMSVTAVQKHVEVLQSVGLVAKLRRGREQIVTTDPARLMTARRVLDQLETMWRERLDRFGEVLASNPEGEAS